jgi:SprT-like family
MINSNDPIGLWRAEARYAIQEGLDKVGKPDLMPAITVLFRYGMRTNLGVAWTNYGPKSTFLSAPEYVRDILGKQDEPGGLLLFNVPLYRKIDAIERKHNILHELAHVVAELETGPKYKVGHGPVWQMFMHRFGEVPERCHSVDVSELRRPRRKR